MLHLDDKIASLFYKNAYFMISMVCFRGDFRSKQAVPEKMQNASPTQGVVRY